METNENLSAEIQPSVPDTEDRLTRDGQGDNDCDVTKTCDNGSAIKQTITDDESHSKLEQEKTESESNLKTKLEDMTIKTKPLDDKATENAIPDLKTLESGPVDEHNKAGGDNPQSDVTATSAGKISKESGEDAFYSDESGTDSEDDYESAEEGEEIHTDTQNLRDMEETLTDDQKQERREAAQELKEEGNELFRTGTYKTAIKTYSRALRTCPLKYPKDRAIMYSNRAACKMRMEENESAIRDCSKAIDLHPHYLKAVMRRAELYEQTDKLDEALADFQKIVELDPSQHSARAACMRLPDQIKERNEKMKEEMMGKLKDLGNMVLRPFGLSTNNFKMNQDPNTGGYSVNFVQGDQG